MKIKSPEISFKCCISDLAVLLPSTAVASLNRQPSTLNPGLVTAAKVLLQQVKVLLQQVLVSPQQVQVLLQQVLVSPQQVQVLLQQVLDSPQQVQVLLQQVLDCELPPSTTYPKPQRNMSERVP